MKNENEIKVGQLKEMNNDLGQLFYYKRSRNTLDEVRGVIARILKTGQGSEL